MEMKMIKIFELKFEKFHFCSFLFNHFYPFLFLFAYANFLFWIGGKAEREQE